MARQTRSQRRARRQAQEASSAGAAPPRQRPPADNGAPEPSGEPQPRHEPQQEAKRKRGFFNFIRESYAELQKVEWPGQSQLIQGVAVVLIACAIVGTYLFFCDQVFKRFVSNVLLGQ